MMRRRFLQAAVGSALCGPLRLWAVPAAAARTRFVLVLLRGGYDAASLLVPYKSALYYQSQPNIAIPRPGAGADTAAELDASWALHPALRGTILPLYREQQVVFVPYAGSQDQSRSHFHAQDVLELGQGYGARLDYGSGFLNRLVEALARGGPRTGVSFTENLPLALKGRVTVANVSVRGGAKNRIDARQAQRLEALYQDTSLSERVHEGLESSRQMAGELQQEMTDSARGAANAKGFEQQARRMARLMLDHPEYAIGFIDVGGWDTHVGQGDARGALSDHLRSLGEGLAGFAEALGPAWRDTVVVVLSEFGRTLRENGNKAPITATAA